MSFYTSSGGPPVSEAMYNGGTQLSRDLSVGTADNYGLTVITNGTAALTIDTSQNVTVAGTLTVTGATIFTGVLEAPNGTAAAPGFTFASDLDVGMYRIAANSLGLSTNGTLALSISSAQNVAISGNVLRVGSSTIGTDSGFRVSSTGLTGTSPNAIYIDPVFPATATGGVSGITVAPSTAASAFTSAYYIGLFPQDITKGAGSGVTRSVGVYCPIYTSGATGNAVVADNLAFSGSYFINQSGTDPSVLGGALSVAGVLSATTAGLKTKVSTANTSNPPTNAELISAFGAAATVGSGFIGVVDDNSGHANEYLIFSDGTKYWQITATAAA